ncbi:subtilase-type protease inhibitor [Streptomyces sp. SCA3-4]|uniref:SSI family serine proteinase inhibitor n=1 Tax=Streptomyces sichuanensis TaxID=2871810 RepID=UPI001CE39B5E|nr:SSI family serine proteinase inhibitor [Streptomyces sichuanensis]MCA6094260.1 subtilase-type protease inhibitor [Streptomyces sichuanensis]
MSVRTTAAAAATATALLALPPAPAQADGKGEGRFLLTVSGAQNTWIRGVQLVCPGPGGHHPHAPEACESLRLANGRPDALPVDLARVCTQEEDPVTATATGQWNGAAVAWRKTFPHACALDAATGPVFRF